MSIPGPSTQRLLDLDYSSDSESSPPPPVFSAPIPAFLTPALLTPALLTPAATTPVATPATTTTPVPVPENTLAAMAEQPPTKPTAAFLRLVKMDRVREVLLRDRKIINWGRATNLEAVLGQTRGEDQEEACKKCKERDGPFTSCVVISGEFSGSCASCHYNSMGASCSFRVCKYFSSLQTF